MKILITGATGFVGKQLIKDLLEKGYNNLVVLSRNKYQAQKKINPTNSPSIQIYQWKNSENELPPNQTFKDIEAVLHLAGDPVADGRWTPKKKQRIYNSRILMTQNLIKGLEQSGAKNIIFISSSAIGYYGDRKDENLTENSPLPTPQQSDFLSKVCKDWENATLNNTCVKRACHLRIGIVLGPGGGALKQMLLPFKLGFGGNLGDGKHWMSWIHIKDLSQMFIFALENEVLNGAINAVSKQSVTNAEFTKTLGKVLKRPTLFPIPKLALKTLFGEKSSILTASQKVSSKKIQKLGFQFTYKDLDSALEDIILN